MSEPLSTSRRESMKPIQHALRRLAHRLLSKRTRRGLRFDARRLIARWKPRPAPHPLPSRLHLGCGERYLHGFLNVDLEHGEQNVDLAAGHLPWPDQAFDAIVSQQVIEHLELSSELQPLLAELKRVLRPGGELWLACPDMEAVCRSYLSDGGKELLLDRQRRWPDFSLGDLPASQMMNVLFHQAGEHLNLLDFRLLEWLLLRAGFSKIERVHEADLLARFSAIPPRRDDEFSLYVRAEG